MGASVYTRSPIIWFPEAYKLLTILWKTQTNLPPMRKNARDSAVHEDHASKINSHKFNLPVVPFLTYQKQKCIEPMYKIEVVWLSSSLRRNSFTLCDEQARSMTEWERRRKLYLHRSNISPCRTRNLELLSVKPGLFPDIYPLMSQISHPQNKLNIQQQVSSKWYYFRCCSGFAGEEYFWKYKM